VTYQFRLQQRHAARVDGRGRQFAHAGKIDRGNPRRQRKSGALFAVARAVDGGIHGDDQCLNPGGFGTLDKGCGEITVRLDVKLKPQRCLRRGGERFQRDPGLGTDHHRGLHRRGGEHGCGFAIRVREVLKRDRGQQYRSRVPMSEQGHRGIASANVIQHPWHEAQAREGVEIVLERQLIARAALHKRPSGGAHALTRQHLVVADGGEFGGNRSQWRQGAVQVSAHSRSRL